MFLLRFISLLLSLLPLTLQLSRQHARNMEALSSIREMKRSGGKGGEEIFMNFGDIFVAGKKEKVEEQLKVMAVALIFLVCVVLLAYFRYVTRFYFAVRTSNFHE
jgi:hypothetical protein